MKQLLIVNSAAALNGGASSPSDLSGMAFGGLGVYALSDPTTWLSAAPTEDFAVVLGRGTNSPAFVIPEVDYNTLKVTVAEPANGTKFKAEVTIPTVSAGNTYTLVLVKKGTVPHERNTWTATESIPVGGSSTSAAIATKLGDYFKRMAETGSINVNVTVASAKITIEAVNDGESFTLKGADSLSGVSITEREAKPAVGDKKYIEDLASRCAAGKGFTDTYRDGDTVYPGYPELVEDDDYTLITLRFAVSRKSAKTRDEVVSQIVHIAVPSESSALSTIKSMFSGIKTSSKTPSDTDKG